MVRRTQSELRQELDDARVVLGEEERRRRAVLAAAERNRAAGRKIIQDRADLPYHHDTPHHYEVVREPRDPKARGFRDLVIAMLIERDGNHCYLCRKDFPANRQPCVEHIIPLSRGGENVPANVALACFGCNAEKASHIVSFGVSSRRPIYTRAELLGGAA